MAKKNGKFKQLERFVATLILCELAFFLFFLFLSSNGIVVLKILCALFCFGIAGMGLWFLSKTKEIFRSRSLWLTCSLASPALLTLISLLCGYPCP